MDSFQCFSAHWDAIGITGVDFLPIFFHKTFPFKIIIIIKDYFFPVLFVELTDSDMGHDDGGDFLAEHKCTYSAFSVCNKSVTCVGSSFYLFWSFLNLLYQHP